MQQLISNRYRIIRSLGSGGMAEVYLAHDEVLNRDIALKILRDSYTDNEEFVERFRREAQSAAALNHPNIVSVYDRGRSEDGTYYIAMEYVPGGTLKECIASHGSLAPALAAGFTFQIVEALGVAHDHGVIHRDIKPQNILLTDTGSVKVTDFGIARAANLTTISQTSFVMGTAAYMSPEQAKGESVGPRSDLYSLGVVLYEMLTGTLPYSAENPFALAMKHVNEPPRSPREANLSVPESLDSVTLKLLAKNPEERYASAAELKDDLERIRSGLPALAASTKRDEKVTVPLAPSMEERTGRTVVQEAPSAASFKAPSSSRGREKLAYALAGLTFGLILLGVLMWALTREQVASEQSGSQETSDSDVAQPSTVQVPKLYYASEAERVLADAGLKLGTRDESTNDTVPAGVVISQDPEAGTAVEEGSSVDILVSTGVSHSSAQTAVSTPPTSAAPIYSENAGKGNNAKGKGKGKNK